MIRVLLGLISRFHRDGGRLALPLWIVGQTVSNSSADRLIVDDRFERCNTSTPTT